MSIRPTLDRTLIDAVRTLHDQLYAAGGEYRKFMDATPETNVEGSISIDEFRAMDILYKAAVAQRVWPVIAEQHDIVRGTPSVLLNHALHAVLLADGLGGSLEAGQSHVAAVRREWAESERDWRDMHGKPPLSS